MINTALTTCHINFTSQSLQDMGTVFARFWCARPIRILIIGLDGSGKTKLLYRIAYKHFVETVPTIGFNIETLKYKDSFITLWDAGGDPRIRPLWRHYTQNTTAIMFVLDCSDKARLVEARDELRKIIQQKHLLNSLLVVISNKQDLPSKMSDEEITAGLELERFKDRKWVVFSTSAIESETAMDAMNWIVDQSSFY